MNLEKYKARLEEVLDSGFPKIEEEGVAKFLNKRPEALLLYAEAVKLIEEAREEALSDAVLQVIPVSMHFVGEGDARCEEYRDGVLSRIASLRNKLWTQTQ